MEMKKIYTEEEIDKLLSVGEVEEIKKSENLNSEELTTLSKEDEKLLNKK